MQINYIWNKEGTSKIKLKRKTGGQLLLQTVRIRIQGKSTHYKGMITAAIMTKRATDEVPKTATFRSKSSLATRCEKQDKMMMAVLIRDFNGNSSLQRTRRTRSGIDVAKRSATRRETA